MPADVGINQNEVFWWGKYVLRRARGRRDGRVRVQIRARARLVRACLRFPLPPGVVEEHVARVMQHGWDARAPLTDRLAQFMQLTGAEIEGTAGACIQCASTPALLRHGSFFVNLMAQGRTPLEMAEVRGGWVRRALGIRVFVSVPRQDVADGARITCVCKQT